MSKCALTIEPARPGGTFVLGETVSGNVIAQASADCRCNRLRVALIRRTHGHGRSDDDLAVEGTLFEGSWKAGEAQAFPYELEIPDGPLTYHGEHLNVDWLVVADADVAAGLDAHAEAALTVVAGDEPARVTLPKGRSPEQAARLGVATGILKVVGGLMVGVPGWLVLGLGIIGVVAGQSAGWAGIVGGAVLALAGTGLVIQGARSLIGTALLKVTHLSLDPAQCRRGGQVAVTLEFSPRRAIEIDEITATLEGEEVVVFSGGKSSTRYSHSIVRAKYTMGGSVSADTVLPVLVSAPLTVARDAPCSFERRSTSHYWAVEWKVRIQVAIRGRPDWTRELVLIVGP